MSSFIFRGMSRKVKKTEEMVDDVVPVGNMKIFFKWQRGEHNKMRNTCERGM